MWFADETCDGSFFNLRDIERLAQECLIGIQMKPIAAGAVVQHPRHLIGHACRAHGLIAVPIREAENHIRFSCFLGNRSDTVWQSKRAEPCCDRIPPHELASPYLHENTAIEDLWEWRYLQ